MKILLYLNSLSVSKDTVVPAFQSRNCVSANDINIVLLFSKSPRNTWKCDELNGNRLWTIDIFVFIIQVLFMLLIVAYRLTMFN